jgi:hypothetical protein
MPTRPFVPAPGMSVSVGSFLPSPLTPPKRRLSSVGRLVPSLKDPRGLSTPNAHGARSLKIAACSSISSCRSRRERARGLWSIASISARFSSSVVSTAAPVFQLFSMRSATSSAACHVGLSARSCATSHSASSAGRARSRSRNAKIVSDGCAGLGTFPPRSHQLPKGWAGRPDSAAPAPHWAIPTKASVLHRASRLWPLCPDAPARSARLRCLATPCQAKRTSAAKDR